MDLKPGLRLSSQACDTEFVVIKGGGDHAIECGGAPAVPVGDPAAHQGGLNEDLAGGTLLGKRYVDAAGSVEVLCTKPGDGALALDGEPLEVKSAKPLPSSD